MLRPVPIHRLALSMALTAGVCSASSHELFGATDPRCLHRDPPPSLVTQAVVGRDRLYLALAAPGADPAGRGNLKKLRLVRTAQGRVQVHDARGQSALTDEGRLRDDLLSDWTDARGTLLDEPVAGADADRDGARVDRGGAGQKIPGFRSEQVSLANAEGLRQLYLLIDGQLTALDASTPLAADTRVQQQFGTRDDAAASLDLLHRVRGARGSGDLARSPQPWWMGDIREARPLLLNYGAAFGHGHDTPAIFIALASHDGFLRLLRDTGPAAEESGEELWAFMPPEGAALQRPRLMADRLASGPPPGGLGGSPVSMMLDRNRNGRFDPGDRVLLYVGLRRGGSSYYALDISDPLAPRFLWRVAPELSDYAELGLSFSTPRLGRLRVGGRIRPALFLAGGYDVGKDRPGPGQDDDRGTGLFVLDAETGELIWKAVRGVHTGPDEHDPRVFRHRFLQDSLPSDLAILDSDADGLIDRLVVGDTGGRLWRADLPAGPADRDGEVRQGWMLALLADLGRHAGSGSADDRRFFHEPDLVRSRDARGRFDGVLIGSGNREDPLDRRGRVHDALFLVKDRDLRVRRWPADRELAEAATVETAGLPPIDDPCVPVAAPDACDPPAGAAQGWRLDLNDGGRWRGEKSLSPPLTLAGEVHFTTFEPPPADDPCADGQGRYRVVALEDGQPPDASDRADDGDGDGEDGPVDGREPSAPARSGRRFEILGIPATPQPLDRSGQAGALLLPDLSVVEAVPSRAPRRTYWYREER